MTPVLEPSTPELHSASQDNGSLKALLQVGESTGTRAHVICPLSFTHFFIPECHPSALVGNGTSFTVPMVTRLLTLKKWGMMEARPRCLWGFQGPQSAQNLARVGLTLDEILALGPMIELHGCRHRAVSEGWQVGGWHIQG